MPRSAVPDLLPAEWAVLGLVAESPTHGYDLARSLGPGGDLGRVWTVSRPLVYRALRQLESRGFVRGSRTQPSPAGPRRTMIRITPAGRRAVERWMQAPVNHVRDVRSTLMLKLALHERRRSDPSALLASQRAAIEDLLRALRLSVESSEGFDAVLAAWRVESAAAVQRFIDRY